MELVGEIYFLIKNTLKVTVVYDVTPYTLVHMHTSTKLYGFTSHKTVITVTALRI
jgi:hypothetical protein